MSQCPLCKSKNHYESFFGRHECDSRSCQNFSEKMVKPELRPNVQRMVDRIANASLKEMLSPIPIGVALKPEDLQLFLVCDMRQPMSLGINPCRAFGDFNTNKHCYILAHDEHEANEVLQKKNKNWIAGRFYNIATLKDWPTSAGPIELLLIDARTLPDLP